MAVCLVKNLKTKRKAEKKKHVRLFCCRSIADYSKGQKELIYEACLALSMIHPCLWFATFSTSLYISGCVLNCCYGLANQHTNANRCCKRTEKCTNNRLKSIQKRSLFRRRSMRTFGNSSVTLSRAMPIRVVFIVFSLSIHFTLLVR